jgi:hypothetical protein
MNNDHVFHNNYVKILAYARKSSNMQDHSKSLQRLHHTNPYSTLFFSSPRKHLNIGLHSLQKSLKFIGFQDFKNNLKIGFRSL